MRFLVLSLCSALLLLSCQSESKPPVKYNKLFSPADSLVKFRSLEFVLDGKPCTALINQGYKNFKKKKEFPLSVFITINTLEKDSVGHPTEKEAKVFNALESKILADLAFETCYIGQTTMYGYRDMIFYIASKDQKKVTELLKSMKKKEPRIRSYTFENDPEWEAVSEFYDQI
ncbi:MAG TPA: hypothetical protein DIT07_06675 [Sphingobacteriaceae bacterium]|nr:hypothetical protein [Sphingobacteriaceae bacterium]